MDSKAKNKEIAIYWDYENVALPKWCGAAEAAKRIYNAVSKYGRVVERRLYFDYQKHSAGTGPQDCSGLDLSGFDLVNTPTRNSKETLDKKLIADVLTFAWDCTARNTEQKPCVVLITSDGDYAYTLAKLRDRGVMNIVMYGKDCSVAQILVENADVSLSFERDVLSEQPVAISPAKPATEETSSRSTHLFFKSIPELEHVNEFVQFIEREYNAPVQRAYMFRIPDRFCSCVHIQFTNTNDGARILNVARSGRISFRGRNIIADFDTKIPTEHSISRASSDCCYERQGPRRVVPPSRHNQPAREQYRPALGSYHAIPGYVATYTDVTKCCVSLYNEQIARTMAPLASAQECDKCWVPTSPFNGSFHHVYSSLPKTEAKGRIKATLEKSIGEGYIAVARRKLDSEAFIGVPWHKNRGVRDDLSREAYLRLTLKGRKLVNEIIFQKRNIDDLLLPRSQGNPGTASAGELQTGSSSSPGVSNAINTGAFLHILNLPDATNVREFVDFLETDHHAHVECAVIIPSLGYTNHQNEAIYTTDRDKYSAHVQLTDAKCGLTLIILALTNGIVFNGVQLKASLRMGNVVASLTETISNSRENDCYFKPESAADLPPKISAMPVDAEKHHADTLERDFCSRVFKEQKATGNTELLPCDQCWAKYSIVGTSVRSSATFCDLSVEDRRQLLKVTRDISIHDGLIEVGRQKLGGNHGFVSVPWLEDRGESESLSKDLYLRLTDAGISLLHNTKLPQKKDPSCVFLFGLPWPIQALDLVQFFEVECQATVRHASIVHHVTNDRYNAHIEFVNADDGSRVCLRGTFIYNGVEISATMDTRGAPPAGPAFESDPMLFYAKSEVVGPTEPNESTDTKVEESSPTVFSEAVNTDVLSGSINGCIAPSHCEGGNDPHFDCDMAATNIDGSHQQQTLAQPEIESNLPFECNLLVTNIDVEEQQQNLDAAITAQDSEEAKEAGDLEGSSKDAVSMHISKLALLQKELDEAIRAKDFAKAASLHATLECLEQDGSDDTVIKSMMCKEIDLAIETKNFTRAATIQARIEGLENGSLTLAEAKTLLRKDLDKELMVAIEAKLFDKAGSIQTRIEGLEKGA